MKSLPGAATVLLPIALCLNLAPVCLGAAIPAACGTIYKSFAQCLLSLGDSLVETQKDQNTQDIDSICRSWNAFHVCASSALAGCPGEAAAIWESLRQESRKTQFSGNLYDMCASRTTLPQHCACTAKLCHLRPDEQGDSEREDTQARPYQHLSAAPCVQHAASFSQELVPHT